MSKITIIHDKILEKLAALYPSKTRIPNAYSLVDNNKNFLKNGYGITIGDASFEPFEFCSFVVNRTISIPLTKEMHRVDSATSETDKYVKELLEEVYQVQKLFYAYNELGIDSDILKIDIGSVSAIETFFNDKQNFLAMTASFSFFIREEL